MCNLENNIVDRLDPEGSTLNIQNVIGSTCMIKTFLLAKTAALQVI